MDGLSLQMPVTLVVKAPNQKIQDLTVECGWEWTIRKLKEHLSNVYPNKPTQNQQKLIYSGKLLQDHQTLKDVLRQYDESQTTHTVHLVCSHMALESHNDFKTKSNQVPSSSTAQENGEGLRHRHPQPTHSTPRTEPLPQPSVPQPVPATQHSPVAPMDYNAMQQMFGANPMMYGGYLPGMMAMTPEQMAWMQQVYTQQMNYFLQMYQAPMPTPPATPTNVMMQPQAPVAPQPEVVAPEARQADQPIRLNAQGGMALDDEDGEDGRRRDWLDWLYTFSRFSVLLSIVYFYSTPSRFILVITFFLFFYLFQGGWFNLNRNAADRRQQPVQQPQEQEPQQQQENPEPAVDQSLDEGSGEEAESSEDETPLGGAPEPVVPPTPSPPSGVEVAWNFFTSFFSSLVPQQPPPVNAN